jgi:hypothetical protein
MRLHRLAGLVDRDLREVFELALLGRELLADDVLVGALDPVVGGVGPVDQVAFLDPFAEPAEDARIALFERLGGGRREVEDAGRREISDGGSSLSRGARR